MSALRAKRDPSFEPLRMHDGFQSEFPDGIASASEAVLNLTVAGLLAVNRVEELLAQYGLVLKGFNVLAIVSGAAEPLTPTVIADRTLAAKTTVTSVLDALEKQKLIRRRMHPSSRRSVIVEPTPLGRRTCNDILRRLHALEAQWFGDMSEQDRQTFVRLLGVAKGLLSQAPRLGSSPVPHDSSR